MYYPAEKEGNNTLLTHLACRGIWLDKLNEPIEMVSTDWTVLKSLLYLALAMVIISISLDGLLFIISWFVGYLMLKLDYFIIGFLWSTLL